MIKKSITWGLILFFSVIFSVNAANVSFLVIETGHKTGNKFIEYSMMWENGLLDVFYDMGYIVSNAPILHIPVKPEKSFPDEAKTDFEIAKSGGMNYFLIAIVEQQNVSLRMFDISNEKMLLEQVYTKDSSSTQRQELENIKNTIMNMITGLKL